MKPFEKAFSDFGIKELPGTEDNNPEILKYFSEIGQHWVKTDETAWCSAFVNWAAKSEGYEYSGALNARSWLRVGEGAVNPKLGDIVVLWRESPESWKGHVGFFIRHYGGFIYILGGNQDNQICIKPYSDDMLLGYRVLNLRA